MYTQKQNQYHRSCYKSFTSKHNLSASVLSTTAENVSNPTENTTSVSSFVLTRSSSFSDIDCSVYKGNNKITELRTIFQRESQNS